MVPITLAAGVVGGLGVLLSATGIGVIVGIPLIAVGMVVLALGIGITWLLCLPFGGFGLDNHFDFSSMDAFRADIEQKLDNVLFAEVNQSSLVKAGI